MHFMAHGIGGFIGGLAGFYLLAVHNTCSILAAAPCQELNALGFEPLAPEVAVTIRALIGIGVWHLVKETVLKEG